MKRALILIESERSPIIPWAKTLQLLSPPQGVKLTTLNDDEYEEVVGALETLEVEIKQYGIKMAEDDEERTQETKHLEVVQKLSNMLNPPQEKKDENLKTK